MYDVRFFMKKIVIECMLRTSVFVFLLFYEKTVSSNDDV